MIDLHTHILPGIDDGSKSEEMSFQMLEKSAQQGVTTLAVTPHFYPTRNSPERFLEKRAQALDRLGTLPEGFPKILVGAEVAYYDGMGYSEQLQQMQLGDTGLLLVEMPFGKWSPRMVQELQGLQDNLGLRPVLAHINRYMASDQFPRYSSQLREMGILFQCNTEAMFGFFSRGPMLNMIKQGKIDFLGTDTHNLTERPPNMEKAVKIITNKLGRETMDRLTARGIKLLNL